MRVLLDEYIDESLRHEFANYECETCRFAGFKGFSNGELVAAAEQAGFDVLITVDQNLPHQQNVANRLLSIVVIQASSTNIDDLIVFIPAVLAAIDSVGHGQVIRIEA